MPINNRSLGNGVTLITEPVAATQTAAIGFWFFTGTRDEKEGLHGAAHFLEHMLFKGTGDKTARDIARVFDRTGGYVNAFTEREQICLYAVIPGSRLPEILPVMMSMLTESSFREEDVETERGVIVSEILSYLDDPEETCSEWFMERTFPESSLGKAIAGTVQSVNAIAVSDLKAFYSDTFIESLSCVTVTGSFDDGFVEKEISRYPRVRSVPSPAILRPEKGLWREGQRVEKSLFTQSQIVLGWPIHRFSEDEDWFSWNLINDILSDTVSSRLFQSLREEKGLCYSITGSVNVFRELSFLSVSLSTPPDRTVEAVRELLRECGAFFTGGPSASELSDAKERALGALTIASEDSEYRMKRLARQWIREGRIFPVERDMEIVSTIGHSSLERRLKAIDGDAGKSLAALVPRRYAKELERQWKRRS